MVKSDLSHLRQGLQRLHSEMQSLLPILMGREPLLKAYLSFIPRTCGNKGCQCYRLGKLHAAWVVRIPQGRQSKTRNVRQETYERLKVLSEGYKRFRKASGRWKELAREAEGIVKEIGQLREVDAEKELEKK